MPFEQRADTSEKVKNRFSSGGRHAAEYTFCKRANIQRGLIVLNPVASFRSSGTLSGVPYGARP